MNVFSLLSGNVPHSVNFMFLLKFQTHSPTHFHSYNSSKDFTIFYLKYHNSF